VPIRGIEAEWPRARSSRGQWGFRIALLALAALAVTVAAFRAGLLSLYELEVAIGAGSALGIIALAIALGALQELWTGGGQGTRVALAGAVAAGLAVAPATLSGLAALLLPRLNDVSTDLQSPPELGAVAEARKAAGAASGPPSTATIAVQTAGYPDIAPLVVQSSPELVFEAVTAMVEERGWTTALARGPDGAPGVVVATDRTLLFGFEDDVSIRVAAVNRGTRVDMRSASRLGDHDLGTNARRIRSFLADLDRRLNEPPA